MDYAKIMLLKSILVYIYISSLRILVLSRLFSAYFSAGQPHFLKNAPPEILHMPLFRPFFLENGLNFGVSRCFKAEIGKLLAF
jgi:hypothetical protein